MPSMAAAAAAAKKGIEGLTLAEQLVADWQHLREGHQLLVLLQQLRQVLAAATDAVHPIQSNPTTQGQTGKRKTEATNSERASAKQNTQSESTNLF
jgi:hypothetical protein